MKIATPELRLNRWALALEFLSLFVVLPGALALWPLTGWPLPVLWVAALYAYWLLHREPGFHTKNLWRVNAAETEGRSILAIFLPAAAVLSVAVYRLAPGLFLNLPRRQPLLWSLVMVLYPVTSVVPQTLLYRAFFFHRYRRFFPNGRVAILASAAAFSWVHLVLRNPVAPILAFPAGLLFAWRYGRSESLLASAVEHALYGCLIFTVGLGSYFITAPAR